MGVTVVSDWQPIETAPKDGTPILIAKAWGGHQLFAAVVYQPVRKRSRKVWGILVCGEDIAIDRDWPTHWMPLPAPPA